MQGIYGKQGKHRSTVNEVKKGERNVVERMRRREISRMEGFWKTYTENSMKKVRTVQREKK